MESEEQQQVATSTGNKRGRDDGVYSPPPPPTEARKRLRSDLEADLEVDLEGVLDDILDDAGEADAAAGGDLASVMRSLEEEIGLFSPAYASASVAAEDEERQRSQPDLGFLLEASDDELGLPPTASEEAAEEEVTGVPETENFGQIWGFEDEIPNCYDGLPGFGFPSEEAAPDGEAEWVVLGGGLFDGLEEEGHTWRQGTLPAV